MELDKDLTKRIAEEIFDKAVGETIGEPRTYTEFGIDLTDELSIVIDVTITEELVWHKRATRENPEEIETKSVYELSNYIISEYDSEVEDWIDREATRKEYDLLYKLLKN